MLSFLGRKKSVTGPVVEKNPDEEGTMVVAVSTLATRPDQEYGLVGFGDALKSDCNIMSYLPEANLTNATVAVNFSASMMAVATDAVSESDISPITQTQFIGNLLTWALTSGAQLLQYFSKFTKLQASSLLLIQGLPMEMITECYAIVGKEKVQVELPKPFTPDSITKFLQQNGMVTVVFETPDTKIDLYDFRIRTMRVGGTAGITGLASAATQTVSIGYFLAQKFGLIDDAQAGALQTAAQVTSSIPLVSIAGKLVETCNCYTSNFITSLDVVITKLYVEPRRLHEISEEILMVADQYCSSKDMLENRKRIQKYREQGGDLESGARIGFTKPNFLT